MSTLRPIRYQLDILNLEGETLSSIDERIVGGQVDVAAKAEGPTRFMSPVLYDPDHRLRLDDDAPTAGSLYATRMLRAWYCVKVPTVGWVNVPIFTGPLVEAERDDALLNLECQGKESIALRPVWENFTVPKGTKKTDAIRRVMRECTGETWFDLPDLPTRLGASATLTPEPPDKRQKFNANTPWGLCQMIAESMEMHLFYDGFGRLRLRRLPQSSAFRFDASVIQTPPKVRFDTTKLRNAVKVTGKTLGEGKEKKGTPQIPEHTVSGKAEAPDDHPLSPKRLGRKLDDGSIRGGIIPEFVTNDAVRSDLEATRLAKRILKDRLVQQVDIEFGSLPIPHLEEMDMVRVDYEDMNLPIRLEKFSLPLTHAGLMTVGDIKRVEEPRRG